MERQKVNLNSDLWRAVMDATGQLRYFGRESGNSGRNGETIP
jgi:hypothetical protein